MGSIHRHQNTPGRSWGCPGASGGQNDQKPSGGPSESLEAVGHPRCCGWGSQRCRAVPCRPQGLTPSLPKTGQEDLIPGASASTREEEGKGPSGQTRKQRVTLQWGACEGRASARRDTHACSGWGSGWACPMTGKMTKLLADKAERGAEDLGLGPFPGVGGRGGGWLCALDGAAGCVAPPHCLRVILGAVAQGKPPLDCSGSPRSKGSRGLGLYSRLGREEASRILQAGRDSGGQPAGAESCACRGEGTTPAPPLMLLPRTWGRRRSPETGLDAEAQRV